MCQETVSTDVKFMHTIFLPIDGNTCVSQYINIPL